jgi:hypothetical protein
VGIQAWNPNQNLNKKAWWLFFQYCLLPKSDLIKFTRHMNWFLSLIGSKRRVLKPFVPTLYSLYFGYLRSGLLNYFRIFEPSKYSNERRRRRQKTLPIQKVWQVFYRLSKCLEFRK